MKVVIYCGIPGSGKTTLAKATYPNAPYCSADKYFEDANGVYRFDPSKLGAAHASCLQKFADMVRNYMSPVIVVDNTNTTIAELAPYAALALAYGHDLEIVTLNCNPETAYSRNKHDVPYAAVKAMADRLHKREMPPWWPQTQVNT